MLVKFQKNLEESNILTAKDLTLHERSWSPKWHLYVPNIRSSGHIIVSNT